MIRVYWISGDSQDFETREEAQEAILDLFAESGTQPVEYLYQDPEGETPLALGLHWDVKLVDLKEKRQMTAMEVAKKIVEHFSQEGAQLSKALDEDVCFLGCRYRLDLTPECPTRCAFGVLIPDEHYKVAMEGKNVRGVYLDYPGSLPGLEDSLQTVVDFQIWHDAATSVTEFLEKMNGWIKAQEGLEE